MVDKTQNYVDEAKGTVELIRRYNEETKIRLDAIRRKSDKRLAELERKMLKIKWLLGENMY